MRFSIVALSLLATSVAAMSLQERQSPYPQCALDCISKADLGNCAASDTLCLCKNTQFVDSVGRCVFATCKGKDLTDANETAQQVCRTVGVTLTSTPVGMTATATGSTQATPITKTSSSSSGLSNRNPYILVSALGVIVVSLL